MNPTTVPSPYVGGRPPKHDWRSAQDEIQTLIDEGYGLLRLSKRYKVSISGMRLVLRRLGLRTRYQASGTTRGHV